MTDFKSPLAVTHLSPYNALGFGVPALPDALLALRSDMQVRLHTSFAHLPLAMQQEAQDIVQIYSGQSDAFFRLFYQPVWSFLHWVMAQATPAIPQAAMDDARTAQALGLFLHLWDDHLCDGQLATTQLALQVRSDAWAAYRAAALRLAQRMGVPNSMVDEHTNTYLSAIHIPEFIDNLDDFCARFERQIAIWTLVPRLMGPAIGGESAGEDLAQILKAFSNAWRVMDDVQDVEDDVLAGVESAVWQSLDANGRQAWAEAHTQAKVLGQLEAQSWAALQAHLDASNCISKLLVVTYDWLDKAAAVAQKSQWPELAYEILAHRPFELPSGNRG
jgi:hypothetical protein